MGHKGGERRGGGEGSQGGRREGGIIPQLWKEKIEYFLANAVGPNMKAEWLLVYEVHIEERLQYEKL